MKKAYLRNKDGYITHIFTKQKEYFGGILEEVISWECDENNTPCETLFVADLQIKWDGCSHWWFKGQDSSKEESNDSYYHICGFNDYLSFIKGMLFVFKVASQTVEMFDRDEIDEFKEYDFLLNDCEIIIE